MHRRTPLPQDGSPPPSDPYRSEAPTLSEVPLVPCPACTNEDGESTGDRLVQLPSGTWTRQPCESCRGLRKLDREGMNRHRMLTSD
jgi:hypothetical protein